MKKKQLIVAIQATIFSVGIGSASNILADVAPPPAPDGSTESQPPPNGSTQPSPATDASTTLPPPPGGLNPEAPEFNPAEFEAGHMAQLDPNAMGSLNKDNVAQFAPKAMGGINKEQVANIPPASMGGMNKEHVANMPPASMGGMDKEHVANIPPASMGGMNKEHVANMPPASMGGMNKEQVANMPPASMGGLTADHVANMPPAAFGGLTAEHIANMPPESRAGLTADDMANTPPEAMAGLTKAHITNTPPEALKGLTTEHLKYSPPEAASGITPEHVAAMPSPFFSGLTKEYIPYVDPVGFEQTADYDKARMLANLNPEEFTFEDIKPMVPSNWEIESDGTMKPPSGITLALPFKSPQNSLPERLKMPEVSDLSKGFGLGGMGPTSVLQELEQGLTEAQLSEFSLTQDENGILNVEGTGGYAGTRFAFIPDNRGMRQGPKGSPPGLSLSDDGKYMIVTPDEREIPVIPAPQNPEGVLNVLPDGSEVEMEEDGNVSINTGDETLSCRFDPLVQSGSDKSPGFHRLHKTDGVLVYEDGTFQNMNAAFDSSDEFLEAAANFPGVTEVAPNAMNGTVKIKYNNVPFHLKPWFAVEKAEEAGPKIEIIEDSSESEGVELVFIDESGNAQIFSAVPE